MIVRACRVKDTEVLPALLECVTAETPLQLLDFVPDGGLWKVAPPLAFKINPLNEAPDNVTVTVLLAVAVVGALMEAPALLCLLPCEGVLQWPAPLE